VHTRMNFWVIGLCGAALLQAGVAMGQDCGPLENAYGPFDYVNTAHRREKLPVVERHHFNSDVEFLVKGQTGPLAHDLDYTLRAFPNHHRALRSMAMLHVREPSTKARFSIECYFDRAKRMNPKDVDVRLIEAWYLHQSGKLDDALAHYKEAEKLRPGSNAARDYNIGLLYFDLKDYEQARAYAKKAYARKYPLDELRTKLRSVNQWKDG
jgi:Tetratricopeptide repeat